MMILCGEEGATILLTHPRPCETDRIRTFNRPDPRSRESTGKKPASTT